MFSMLPLGPCDFCASRFFKTGYLRQDTVLGELQLGNCNTHDAALASLHIVPDAVPYHFTALTLCLRLDKVKQSFFQRYLTTL
jgi:hypothetical protein